MALIVLSSKGLATIWTPKGINTMRHDNSVLHQILKHIPWPQFERLVQARQADKHVRRLTTKSQFVAMLYAQRRACASSKRVSKATRRGCIMLAPGRCAARRSPMPIFCGQQRFSPICSPL